MKIPAFKFGVFVFLLSCFTSKPATASHIMGAEIMCSLDSGTTYTITVLAYRDCNGIQLSGNELVADDGSNITALNPKVCCGSDVTPICESSCSRCESNPSCYFPYGFEQFTITAKIDVSQFNSCRIDFYWVENGALTTTNIDKNSHSITIYCELNRCQSEHSSPQFQFIPNTFCINNQAYDQYVSARPGNIGDSMVYHLFQPMGYTSYPIQMDYDTPFTYLSPMHYLGFPKNTTPKPKGFHYDSLTGEFYFTPNHMESTFIGWEVDEYAKDSNGKYYLASYAQRSCEMYCLADNYNHPPKISSLSISSQDTIYSCANVPISFKVFASDSDSKDKDSMYILNETNGKVLFNKGHPDTAYFSWSPQNSDARPQPYPITFSARDNVCPVYGFTQRRFYIIVKDSQPVTGIDLIDSGCGKYHIGLKTPVNKYYAASYIWTIDGKKVSTETSFSYFNNYVGMHIINLNITGKSGCSESYADTFYYDPGYTGLKHDTGICKGESVQLFAPNSSNNLNWSPTTWLSDSSVNNPIATPDTTIVYTISDSDSKGCLYKDYKKITVSDFNVLISGNTKLCGNETGVLYVNDSPGVEYTWAPQSAIVNDYGDSVSIRSDSSNVYTVTGNKDGCVKSTSRNIPFYRTILPDTKASVCPGDTVTFHLPPHKTDYSWVDAIHNQTVVGNDSLIKIRMLPNLGYGVSAYFRGVFKDTGSGCMDTGYYDCQTLSFGPWLSKNIATDCKGVQDSLQAFGGTSYLWKIPGLGTSDSDKIKFTATTFTIYTVTISDSSNGCSSTLQIPIYVGKNDSMLPAHNICRGDTITIYDSGGINYSWFPSHYVDDRYSPQTHAFPVITTTYHVMVTDSASGCTRTDSMMINVDNDCIWPGDANEDGIANYLDVLNIGLGYGTKGTARNPDSTNWHHYSTGDWTKSLSNGINFKHFDCNGDGVIDAKDTSVISVNYGFIHHKWTPGTGNPNDPPVYFKFSKDTFYAGDTVSAYLVAGTATLPLMHGYGIGYQAFYIADPLVSGTAKFQPFCNYFCSGHDLNYIRPYYTSNAIEGTIVETNGIGSTNKFGAIGSLTFILKDSLDYNYPDTGEWIYARLSSAIAIDSTGAELNIFGKDDSAIVLKSKKKPTGISPQYILNHKVHIYPIPAQNELVVETASDLGIYRIIIENELGQIVMNLKTTNQKCRLDVSSLPSGLYYIELETKNSGAIMKKVVIQR